MAYFGARVDDEVLRRYGAEDEDQRARKMAYGPRSMLSGVQRGGPAAANPIATTAGNYGTGAERRAAMPPPIPGVERPPPGPMPPPSPMLGRAVGAPGLANPAAAMGATNAAPAATGAAAPAAAAAGVNPYAAAAAVAAQWLGKQQEDAAMRKAAQQQILARRAGEAGGNTAPLAAAQANQKIRENEGPDYLSQILPLLRRG